MTFGRLFHNIYKHAAAFTLFMLLHTILHAQDDTTLFRIGDTLSVSEVVITARVPVVVRGDTVSYMVDSFNRDPQASTEDVLRRLPGVEISNDGTITIEGKPLSKIFINGKEYTVKDLTTITQNLPAEVLDRIQVMDWYSEESRFSGVKTISKEKVINLRFKKKYSGGFYGRGAAGAGTKHRYQGNVFGNYLNKNGTRVTAILNTNNTSNFNIGNSPDAGISGNTAGTPGLMEDKRASLNFATELNKSWTIDGTYSFNDHQQSVEQSSFRTTFIGEDTTLLLSKRGENSSTNAQHNLAFNSRYAFGDKAKLNTTFSAGIGTQTRVQNSYDITAYDTISDVNFSRYSRSNTATNSNNVLLRNVLYKRFDKERRTLIATNNTSYQSSKTDGDNFNQNKYYATGIVSEVINNTNEKNNSFSTVSSINYNEPIGQSGILTVGYTYSFDRGASDRAVLVDNVGVYIEDTIQSRQYNNTNEHHKSELSYNFSQGKTMLTIGGMIDHYIIKSYDDALRTKTVNMSGANYYPNVLGSYALTERSRVQLQYSGNVQSPSLDQLRDVPDYTDSLNIYIGNPNLKPSVRNNGSLRYTYNDHKKRLMFYANANLSWVNNDIVEMTTLNSSKSVTTPINANGNYNVSLSSAVSFPVAKEGLDASINAQAAKNNRVTVVNGARQVLENISFAPSLSLRYYSQGIYSGSLNYQYRINSTDGVSVGNTLQNHNISHIGTFNLPFKITLSYYLSYILNDGYSSDLQKDFLLVNMGVDKTFTKVKGLALRINAFDLINSYPTVNRTFNSNYIEDRTTNRLGRYLLFSVIYKFNKF